MSLVTNEKQPWEELDFPFDFSNRGFASGVTIVSIASITSSLQSGAGGLTISGATFSGLTAVARYAAGVSGDKYKVTCRVVLSDGQKAEADGTLKVKDE